MQPIFPAGIWDGKTPNRESQEQVKSPDAHDASRMISEIIAIETFLKDGVLQLDKIKGPQGVPGERGITGERGLQGERGDTGPVGPIGPRGEVGPIGPQGEAGLIGQPGPEGQRGERGERGETGERGAQGIRGPRGETLKFAGFVNQSQIVTHNLGTQDVCISVYVNNRLATSGYEITLIDSNNIDVTLNSPGSFYLVIIG